MVTCGYSSIRAETAELNVSKEGFTPLFVDQASLNADDDNDGGSWTQPKLTIGGALQDADAWSKTYIRPGIYRENLVLAYEHMELIGVARDGMNRVEISPASGCPLTITRGACEVSNMAFIATNDHAVKANTSPEIKLRDLYAEVNNAKYAMWLNDCDRALVERCFLDGKSTEGAIGLLIGSDTVDLEARHNYITGFGSGGLDTSKVGYGIAAHTDSQRSLVEENILINNYTGVFLYKNATWRGNDIIRNQFFENSFADVYDEADSQGASTNGNSIRNNFYCYTGWFDDNNNDGIADSIVNCYGSYDLAPLAGPRLWKCDHIPRVKEL